MENQIEQEDNFQEVLSKEYCEIFKNSKIDSKTSVLESIYKKSFVNKILLKASKPHIAIQVIKEFLKEFSRKEFEWFCSDLAKKILDKENIDDKQILKIFVKKLREKCQEIELSLQYPFFLEKVIKKNKQEELLEERSLPLFEVYDLVNLQDCIEQDFVIQKLFLWDFAFLKVLKGTGTHGKAFAKKIALKLQGNAKGYFQTSATSFLLDSWFVEIEEGCFFFSPVFLILAEAVFLDHIQKLHNRKKKMFQQLLRQFGTLPLNPHLQKISLSK